MYFRRSAVTAALSRTFSWSHSTACRSVLGLDLRTVGRTVFVSERSLHEKFGAGFLDVLRRSASAIELLEPPTRSEAPPSV